MSETQTRFSKPWITEQVSKQKEFCAFLELVMKKENRQQLLDLVITRDEARQLITWIEHTGCYYLQMNDVSAMRLHMINMQKALEHIAELSSNSASVEVPE